MKVGERLRRLRKERKLTLDDMERKTGVTAPYLSRMENGYFVPSLSALEKLLRVFRVSMYKFMAGISASVEESPTGRASKSRLYGNIDREKIVLRRFQTLFERMTPENRELLLQAAKGMQKRRKPLK